MPRKNSRRAKKWKKLFRGHCFSTPRWDLGLGCIEVVMAKQLNSPFPYLTARPGTSSLVKVLVYPSPSTSSRIYPGDQAPLRVGASWPWEALADKVLFPSVRRPPSYNANEADLSNPDFLPGPVSP